MISNPYNRSVRSVKKDHNMLYMYQVVCCTRKSVRITPAAVTLVKLSQMTWPCESIRWRSAAADSLDSKSQPAAPQWRGRFGQLASCTSRFPVRIGLLQNLQVNGRSSIIRRRPKSTTILKGTALQTGHSLSSGTCSSQSTWWQPAQHTGFVTTSKQTGHSNARAGRLIGSRPATETLSSKAYWITIIYVVWKLSIAMVSY